MVRLVGLWTEPQDIDAFEREYLGSHFPRLGLLPGSQTAKSSRAFDGPYFRLTEVEFLTTDNINNAFASDIGKQVLTDARALADKYGVRLDVMVITEPS